MPRPTTEDDSDPPLPTWNSSDEERERLEEARIQSLTRARRSNLHGRRTTLDSQRLTRFPGHTLRTQPHSSPSMHLSNITRSFFPQSVRTREVPSYSAPDVLRFITQSPTRAGPSSNSYIPRIPHASTQNIAHAGVPSHSTPKSRTPANLTPARTRPASSHSSSRSTPKPPRALNLKSASIEPPSTPSAHSNSPALTQDRTDPTSADSNNPAPALTQNHANSLALTQDCTDPMSEHSNNPARALTQNHSNTAPVPAHGPGPRLFDDNNSVDNDGDTESVDGGDSQKDEYEDSDQNVSQDAEVKNHATGQEVKHADDNSVDNDGDTETVDGGDSRKDEYEASDQDVNPDTEVNNHATDCAKSRVSHFTLCICAKTKRGQEVNNDNGKSRVDIEQRIREEVNDVDNDDGYQACDEEVDDPDEEVNEEVTDDDDDEYQADNMDVTEDDDVISLSSSSVQCELLVAKPHVDTEPRIRKNWRSFYAR